MSTLDTHVTELHNRIGDLENIVDHLADRLSPVMVNYENPAGHADEAIEGSELSREVYHASSRVRDIQDIVEQILADLDLSEDNAGNPVEVKGSAQFDVDTTSIKEECQCN